MGRRMFKQTQRRLAELDARIRTLEAELDGLLDRFAFLIARHGGAVTFTAEDLRAIDRGEWRERRTRLARIHRGPDEEWRLE